MESRGGTVDGYGLAASQLSRLRDADLPLTMCIDKIATSGGYMMAAVANKIVAAPFSYIGSIGVMASLVNANKGVSMSRSPELLVAPMTSNDLQ